MMRFTQGWFVAAALAAACSLIVPAEFAAVQIAQAQNEQDDQNEQNDPKEVDAATKAFNAAKGLHQRAQERNSAALYKLAVETYAEALDRFPAHPESADARYFMGLCHYQRALLLRAKGTGDTGSAAGAEDIKLAISTIEAALAAPKLSAPDEALAVLGHCYRETAKPDKALATFEKIIKDHPKSQHAATAALYRAHMLYQLDRKDDALQAAASFVEKHPQSPYRSNGLYTLGITQHALKKYKEGEATFTKLLSDYPAEQNPYAVDALMLLGQCREGQTKLKEAAEAYSQMLELAPEARHPEALYRRAVVRHNAGELKAAIEDLSKVVKDFEESTYAAPARLQLGKTLYDAQQLDDARKALEAVAKNDAGRANEARYWLAQCDINEGKFEPALKTLDDLGSLSPAPANADEVAFFRAVCRMQLGQYKQAGAAFAAYRKDYAEQGRAIEAMYHQAFCLHQAKDYKSSADLCATVEKTATQPWSSRAKKLLAENLFLSGDYKAAETQYTALISAAQDDREKTQIACRLGQCAYFDGRFAEAAKRLQAVSTNDAVANDRTLRRVIFLHGDALLQTKQYKNAVDPLSRYVKLKDDDEEARYKLGLAQLRSQNESEAIKTFETVAKGKDDSPWVQRALYERGQLLYKQKEPKQAADTLTRLLKSNPPAELGAPAKYLLAWINFDAGEYDKAAELFKTVAADHPQHELAPQAVFQQGVSLNEAKKTDEAIVVLRSYVSANPSGKHVNEAKHLIGAGLATLEKHDEAVKVLGALAADQKARNDSVLYDLAWSQRALEQNDKAIATYRALLESFGSSKLTTPARIELAELLYEKKDYTTASSLIETALTGDNSAADPKTLAAGRYRLGWCYLKTDKPSQAAESFAAFAKANPKDELAGSALYQGGLAYRQVGKLPEAQQQFKTLLSAHKDHELAAVAMLRLGETQAEANQYSESADTYKKFINAHPKSEYLDLALYGVGWALFNQKQYDEARSWFAKVIDVTNTVTAAKAQFQIGECYFSQQQFDKAAKELLKVDIVYDYKEWSAKALYEAGLAFEQLKQPEDAAAQYERCLENYGKEPVAELCKKRLAALKS